MKKLKAQDYLLKSVDCDEDAGGLPVVRNGAAGIDLGSEIHWVCAPRVDGAGREVARFGATTPELERMAAWLKERKVETVALESTGVYWIAPHEVLERHGFELVLVNTRELGRVPGRKKTDRVDCKWIQRLHSCGLLMGSFRPGEAVCMLRTLVRDRSTLVAEAADWLRRMQKSLDQMNVRVHRAVSDIDGLTGMAIMRAIVQGERDARQLAKLRNWRCHKSEEEIAEQLSGHWREDHLFSLRQALKMYDSIQERIGEYEREILKKLTEMETEQSRGQDVPKLNNTKKGKEIKSRGEEPMRQALYRISGVDLTTIDAISVGTVQVVMSEYGPDLSRFATEKQFVSHLTLAPEQAHEWRQGSHEKEKTGHSEHPRSCRAAHGGTLHEPQPDGTGSLLSADRAPYRRRCRRLCHGKETRNLDLSPVTVGTTLHRPGRASL